MSGGRRIAALREELLAVAAGTGAASVLAECSGPRCSRRRSLPGLPFREAERVLAREGWTGAGVARLCPSCSREMRQPGLLGRGDAR